MTDYSFIDSSAALQQACTSLAGVDYITVDTEFLRDRTYWPVLCLIQVAGPKDAFIIDPMAKNMDLAPFLAVLNNPKILKVFHAARQDIEIFYQLTGAVPHPIFDTQIAAMVCGFGDQVGYQTLAAQFTNIQIDKTSRFTDWARRPLSKKQLDYAISDVTHLRVIYEKLQKELTNNKRVEWLEEEMAILTSPDTYDSNPDEMWKKIRTRSHKPRFLARVKEVAAWRERQAQKTDIPRTRLLKDEAILGLAAENPKNVAELQAIRMMAKNFNTHFAQDVLDALKRANDLPEKECPRVPKDRGQHIQMSDAMMELLKVLLKSRCAEHGVAQKLVASSDDLLQIAANDKADVPAMHGWRYDIFGKDAIAIKHGRLGMAFDPKSQEVKLVSLS